MSDHIRLIIDLPPRGKWCFVLVGDCLNRIEELLGPPGPRWETRKLKLWFEDQQSAAFDMRCALLDHDSDAIALQLALAECLIRVNAPNLID